MKRFLLLIISVVLALSSCQKQDFVKNQDLNMNGSELLAQDQHFVSKDKASEVAGLFFSSNPTTKGAVKSIATIDAINDENGTPIMYVINYINGGFVVISATKEYNPVLAFSEDNTFSTKNIQSGVTLWIEEKKFDITEVKKGAIDSVAIKNIAMEWERYDLNNLTKKTLSLSTKSNNDPFQAMANRIRELENMDGGYQYGRLSDAYVPSLDVNYYVEMAQQMGSNPDLAIVGVRVVSNAITVGPLRRKL